jgi:hypothetical protein
MISYRKQGPILPTLIVQVSPDPATDKLRKRRSSRTVGLTTTKDTGPTTLWFRTGDEQQSLHDWARHILSLIQPMVPNNNPLSPLSPGSPTFINPFQTFQDAEFPMPPSTRPSLLQKASSQIRKSRPRTYTSGSPSLRSTKSDLSSQASSVNPTGMGYIMQGPQNASGFPVDIPSPATTAGDYQVDYMLGRTSAQGRSSTVNSPASPVRESLSSQGQPKSLLASSPPTGPRETILDRAFSMKCIPGTDREVPGEEKLSSLARFDALMRDIENRRRQERPDPNLMTPMTSTWDDEEDSEEDADLTEEV